MTRQRKFIRHGKCYADALTAGLCLVFWSLKGYGASSGCGMSTCQIYLRRCKSSRHNPNINGSASRSNDSMGSPRLHGFCVCIAKCDSTATLVCGAADANSTTAITAIMMVITSVQVKCPANATGQAVVSWPSADLSRHRHTHIHNML